MEKSSKPDSDDKFVFDTSAFLSLESVTLLDTTLNTFSIFTTFSVIKELQEFAVHKDSLGIIASKVLSKKSRFILKNPTCVESIPYVSDVDVELFNLAITEKVTLVTDDLKLIYHTSGKIERAFSTNLLTTLVAGGFLTKSDALKRLEQMRNIRNWQSNIIYLSTKEVLNNFNEERKVKNKE